MTNDAIAVLNCLFQTIWSLFTSWHIPGTNVTPAGFFLFLISAGIGLRYALLILHRPPAGYGNAVIESAKRGSGVGGHYGVTPANALGTGSSLRKG